MPAARDFDAVFYSEDVPGIEYRGGAFHVTYTIRKCYFEFVLPADVFEKAVLLAEEAIALRRLELLGCPNVTPIRGKKKH